MASDLGLSAVLETVPESLSFTGGVLTSKMPGSGGALEDDQLTLGDLQGACAVQVVRVAPVWHTCGNHSGPCGSLQLLSPSRGHLALRLASAVHVGLVPRHLPILTSDGELHQEKLEKYLDGLNTT